MKAKLLKEQMGVPAGTEMEVLETGRAWTLRAPSGNEIVVPACDVEMVPDTEPLLEPKPLLLVADEYQELLDEQRNSEVELKTDPAVRDADGNADAAGEPESFGDVIGSPIFATTGEDAVGSADATGGEESVFPSRATPLHEVPLDPPVATDEDLDEALPEPQGGCDGEACEACQ